MSPGPQPGRARSITHLASPASASRFRASTSLPAAESVLPVWCPEQTGPTALRWVCLWTRPGRALVADTGSGSRRRTWLWPPHLHSGLCGLAQGPAWRCAETGRNRDTELRCANLVLRRHSAGCSAISSTCGAGQILPLACKTTTMTYKYVVFIINVYWPTLRAKRRNHHSYLITNKQRKPQTEAVGRFSGMEH